MLMPDNNGRFHCEESDCDFETLDVFDLLDHCGIEFSWGVKVSKGYTFDLFGFLETLNAYIDAGNLEDAYEVVQSAALLMCNASENQLDELIEEVVIKNDTENLIMNLERMLNENG